MLLLGSQFAQYRVWDGIRAVDYLLSRPEVDPERIGCTGQSGGGTMTMYLAALEPRIKVAVTSDANSENVAGPSYAPPGAVDDAEQNVAAAFPKASTAEIYSWRLPQSHFSFYIRAPTRASPTRH